MKGNRPRGDDGERRRGKTFESGRPFPHRRRRRHRHLEFYRRPREVWNQDGGLRALSYPCPPHTRRPAHRPEPPLHYAAPPRPSPGHVHGPARICRYWSAGRPKRGCRPSESRGEAAVADNDTTFPSTAAGARLLRRWRRYARLYGGLVEPSSPPVSPNSPPPLPPAKVRARLFYVLIKTSLLLVSPPRSREIAAHERNTTARRSAGNARRPNRTSGHW